MKRERISAVRPASVDYIARKVLMSAVLYYGFDSPLVSDAQYDAWCKAIKQEWDVLDPVRQWQLRTPKDVTVSGFDFRITEATAGGAYSWMDEHGVLGGRKIVVKRDWKFSKKQQVSYLFPEDFKLE